MNEIDFQKLRRQERESARSRNEKQRIIPAPESAAATSDEANTVISEEPYETLLASTLSERHRIHPPHTQIDSVYYAKHFLRKETCQEILVWLQSLPEYSRRNKLSEHEESIECNGKWTTLKHARRKVALFDASIAPLPPILSRLAKSLVQANAFTETPNHVLINEYDQGMGIMPHTDGPAYKSRTATVSIGGDVLFKLTKQRNDNQVKEDTGSSALVMEVCLHGCGSLIVFANSAYSNHCHGIDETMNETTTGACSNEAKGVLVSREHRVSLTFRHKK